MTLQTIQPLPHARKYITLSPSPFIRSFDHHTVRAFTGVSPPRLFHRGSFPPANMPSADFSHVIRAGYPHPQPIPPARGGQERHGRSPGVTTYLSTHERRVYIPGLRWIEDFTLCCGLVPPGPPNSVLVHRPVRLRYPASAGRLPPRVPSPSTRLPYRYALLLHQDGPGTCP